MKYPALEIRFAPGPGAGALQDLLYAELDAFEPTAIEDHEIRWRVFFTSSSRRDEAGAALRSAFGGHVLDLARLDVDDEDWARRSQADLKAVTVGNIVVAPPWDASAGRPPQAAGRSPLADDRESPILIVITPSMGFGTGHHATTRLCLELLQSTDVRGKRVLDVGTGSGVLAIAAARLGAATVMAIDNDPDAVENARENIEANRVGSSIDLRVADLAGIETAADVLVANITAAALTAFAATLQTKVAPGGRVILSGFSPNDSEAVAGAWSTFEATTTRSEGEWAALALTPRDTRR